MKALVVVDSVYGNTRQVAEAIAGALDGARLVGPDEVDYSELSGLDLLAVGAPTQAGRPMPSVKAFLGKIPAGAPKDARVCAFDTRVAAGDQGFGMRLLLGVIGYAAPRIGGELRRKGGRLTAPPEGFIVEGTEGPLRDGELERAARWAAAFAPRLS